MRLDLSDGDEIGVDMGPLIDCVFLLLIFFLVSTTMKKPEPEIPVNLPDSAISSVISTDRQVQTLTVDLQGNFFWGSSPIGQHELHQRIRQWGSESPNAPLRIRVDRDTPSRFLIQVMDLSMFEGLTNYSIHTRDREAEAIFRSAR